MPGSRGNKSFDRGQERPRVRGLFNQLKLSKGAAEGKDEKRRLRAEMRRNVGVDYYSFNRDEDDGTEGVESFRNVERAGEDGVPEGWTLIVGVCVVPRLDEVTEFLVERRKIRRLQRYV